MQVAANVVWGAEVCHKHFGVLVAIPRHARSKRDASEVVPLKQLANFLRVISA
jgi:hypothetical protein